MWFGRAERQRRLSAGATQAGTSTCHSDCHVPVAACAAVNPVGCREPGRMSHKSPQPLAMSQCHV
eukprot:1610013-Prymnesium_polylepis.1